MAMIPIALTAWLAYWGGIRLHSDRWGKRWGLCVLLGGLAGYNYMALGLPGSSQVLLSNGMLGLVGISLIGELLGLGFAWLWSRRS
jgi:hypothetical protein